MEDAIYKFKREKQISFTDFNQPMGLQMNPDNRWVKKAAMIPWETIEAEYAKLFPSHTGMPAKPLRMALGSLLIQKQYHYPDEELVEGGRIVISGGNYTLENSISEEITRKGSAIMRIAVTYENGQIFQHFGRTEQFKLYDVADGKIISEQIVGTMGAGHGALAGFLKNAQADVLICGGIGGGAQMAMQEAGIALYGGNMGSADDAVASFLANTLVQNENPTCDHHHEHGEGHSCGTHSCGGH